MTLKVTNNQYSQLS